MNIKLAIIGAMGRMGKRITELCLEDKDIKVEGLIEHPQNKNIGKEIYPSLPKLSDDLTESINLVDVVIDFSSPESTLQNLEICRINKKAIVIGTTGFNSPQLEKIKLASNEIPIVLSPNMSVGVNTMFRIVEYIIKILKDKNYDIEIVEAHHNKKKDAPSGTAKKIMDIIKTYRPETKFVFGREGLVGERSKNEVGVLTIRAGDIVGDHTILFSTSGERLEIKHTATSRDTFATGAIVAAKWVINKPVGFYSMFDVLGL